MALFDWMELAAAAGGTTDARETEAFETYEAIFKGSFGVTVGTAIASFIGGGRVTHIYGDEVKFVWDWQAWLEKITSKFGEKFSALANGIGGNTTMVVGTDASLKYGSSTTVKRAHTTDVTGGPNFLASIFSGEPPAELDLVGTDAQKALDADKAAGLGAGLCVAVMILGSLAWELTVKILAASNTTDWKKAFATSSVGAIPGPAGLSSLLTNLETFIGARLGAMAFTIETAGMETRKAMQALEKAKQELKDTSELAKKCGKRLDDLLDQYDAGKHGTVKVIAESLATAQKDITDGAQATKDAAEAAEKALAGLASLTGVVKVTQSNGSSDLELTSIRNFTATATADFKGVAQGNMTLTATSVGEDIGRVSVEGSQAITLTCGGTAGRIELAQSEDGFNTITVASSDTINLYAGTIGVGARVFMTDTGMLMRVGAPMVGPRINIDSSSIELAVGAPVPGGASIKITETGISISVGASSIKLTPESIAEVVAEIVTRNVAATGHTLKAAETSFAVGVTGITITTPIINVNGDATLQIQGPMNTSSADGILTVGGTLTNVGK